MLANKWNKVVYVGVTNNLARRLREHQTKFYPQSFSPHFTVDKLIYYEMTNDVHEAICREKQINRWRREKKLRLVKTINLGLGDLGGELLD